MKKFLLLFCLIGLSLGLLAQPSSDVLLSGPMVGYTAMREAMLWVQTNGPAEVSFTYQAEGEDQVHRTATYPTLARDYYTLHVPATQVKPGKTYTYQVIINGKAADPGYPCTFKTPPLWQYRTDPPNMNIALGSCTFINDETYDRPGRPYGGQYEIFTALAAERPDMMLWLGDNVYLREADWDSRTGIIHRYTHTRRTPEMQPLLASCANYAIWDDHDYGPNNSDYTFANKALTLEAFKLFWGNPTYGLPGIGGTTASFEWGDAQFFMVDNRWFRDPNNKQTETRTLLGKEQLDWLVDALISSHATWKFVMVGCQVLNTHQQYENYSNIAPEERTYLMNKIVEEQVRNVVFLTGDRHHSELSKFEKDGIAIYDFTVSPLTSGSHDAEDEPNTLRVPDSQYGKRNYGMIQIEGARLARKARLTLHDVTGKEIFAYEIEAAYRPRR